MLNLALRIDADHFEELANADIQCFFVHEICSRKLLTQELVIANCRSFATSRRRMRAYTVIQRD
jgi:hypothetical protein